MPQALDQELVGSPYSYREQDPEYKGEPLEQSLRDGPTEERKCRDIIFCLVYLAFWAGLIVIAAVAFANGDPRLLAAPFDSTGQQCGYSPGYSQLKYIYFNQSNPSQFCCIDECPTVSTIQNSNCRFNNTNINCVSFGVYNTTRVMDICYPTNSTIASTVNVGIGAWEKNINDIKTAWPLELSILFMALLVSLLVMVLIRQLGGCIIWSLIIIYFVGLTAFGGICFYMSKDPEFANKVTSDSALHNPQNLQWLAITAWVIDGISLIIFICSFRAIRTAVFIVKATADFTKQTPTAIVIPSIMYVLMGLFFSFWIVVSIYIFSSGTPGACGSSPYNCITWNDGVKRTLAYYLIGLFWNCQFAIALGQFTIASTAAFWYFSKISRTPTSSPVCKSFTRALVFHFGSLAFGALLTTIMLVLQIFLEVFHAMAKNKTIGGNQVQNACTRFCIKCATCCLACFERFIRFITKNAYIMMAISGEGFCSAAHQAFYLIMRSKSEYAVTHGLGHIITVFAKLVITLICTLSGYLMVSNISYFSDSIFSPVAPTVMFFVISFVVANLFMDVFGTAADAILLCYAVEVDINKGLTQACPASLRAFFNEYR